MSRARQRSRSRAMVLWSLCAMTIGILALHGCKNSDTPAAMSHGDDHDMSEMSMTSEMTAPTIVRPNPNVPHLEFRNQDDEPVHLADFVGKPVLISFIYTRCPMPNMCPMTTQSVAKVQALLSPEERTQTQIVSLTFDPEYDSPKVLKEYGQSFEADFSNWQFWTGSQKDTTDLMDVYGAWAMKSGDDFDHNMRGVILAPDGSFATELRGSNWDSEQAAARLRELIGQEG